VVVTEQGASLFKLTWDGAELLDFANEDGFGAGGAHGQLLVPWPGRVASGAYRFDGEEYELPVDDQATGSAIHGFARWLTWAPRHRDTGGLTMGTLMLARPGYPFCFDLEQSYTWSSEGLNVAFSATNVGARTAPFGYGCHPYLKVGTASVDDGVLCVPAAAYIERDDALGKLPPAKPVDGTPYDFRSARPVGNAQLDVTFAALTRDANGKASASFASASGEVRVTCSYGTDVNYLQVFTGDTLSGAARRRGLAIEPYTCAPNAFNNGLGLLRVAPGETVRADWSISAASR
jgi:aldose 1-epimerase